VFTFDNWFSSSGQNKRHMTPSEASITKRVTAKGVGPSATLAWPGWKQPDIAVEVDTARLETSRTDTEKELPGYSLQNVLLGISFFEEGLSAGGE
jgi:hypothetical protein